MNCLKSCTILGLSHFHNPTLRQRQKFSKLKFIPNTAKLGRLESRVKYSAATQFLIAEGIPARGDLSVLIPTAAALFLLYGVANFVVPNFIFKKSNSDEDSDSDD